MSGFGKLLRGAGLALLFAAAAAGSALGALFLTPVGSRWLTVEVLQRALSCERVRVGRTEGFLLLRGLTLRDLELSGVRDLPPGSRLEAQGLKVRLSPLAALDPRSWVEVRLENAALRLPESTLPVVLFGRLEGGRVDLNLYAKSVGLEQILRLLPEPPAVGTLSGRFSDLDLDFSGFWRRWKISGAFTVDRLSRSGVVLRAAPVEADLELDLLPGRPPRLQGRVKIRSGLVQAPAGTSLDLEQSALLFTGEPTRPALNLRGTAQVEAVRIRVVLKGTPDRPDLRLTSTPPLAQPQLLAMLVTGRGWSGAGTLLEEGKVPADLALDFVDYFLLGGSGQRLSRRMGLQGVSLQMSPGKQGIEIRKEVAEGADLGIKVERSQPEAPGAEIPPGAETGKEQTAEGSVTLEYKRNF